ncbi:MAG TPA: PQQ-binding-like beta-propeller repeat protein [Chloroflexia bacterium]|nr:PQQ-binding-like beta-propeller repeat protein [Chloroflexia bacterium]
MTTHYFERGSRAGRGAWMVALAGVLAACAGPPAPPTPATAPGPPALTTATATLEGGSRAGATSPAAPSSILPLAAPASGAAGDSGPGPDDWPMYGHDPSRTNYNPGETRLTPDNVEQMGPRWQAAIGSGLAPPSSAPSVAGGLVYVGSSVTTGPNFLAYDATTGALAWGATLGHVPTCFNVGIGATPAIAGKLVVAGGTDSAYYGLDAASGAVVWRQPLNAGPSAFPWASPLITAGRAYVGVASGCDNPPVRGAIQALDLQTGSLAATQAFVPAGQAGAGIWNSPALSPDGQTLVVATGEDYGGYDGPYNRAIVTLDPVSLAIGQANQQGPAGSDRDYATTPVIFHDSHNRTLVAAQHKDNNLYTYVLGQVANGPLWQRHTGTIVGMMPAYDPTAGDGGSLFFVDGLGQLNAVDPASGMNRWPAIHVGFTHGNMALANGMIFVNAGEEGVLIFDEADGRLLVTLIPSHGGKSYSGVAVAQGFVYWLAGGYLNAWSLTGAP